MTGLERLSSSLWAGRLQLAPCQGASDRVVDRRWGGAVVASFISTFGMGRGAGGAPLTEEFRPVQLGVHRGLGGPQPIDVGAWRVSLQEERREGVRRDEGVVSGGLRSLLLGGLGCPRCELGDLDHASGIGHGGIHFRREWGIARPRARSTEGLRSTRSVRIPSSHAQRVAPMSVGRHHRTLEELAVRILAGFSATRRRGRCRRQHTGGVSYVDHG